MPERIPESLQQKIEERLRYYEDLGIQLFFRERVNKRSAAEEARPPQTAAAKQAGREAMAEGGLSPKKVIGTPLPAKSAPAPSLFEVVSKVSDDTLLRIREDIGDCTRCKLHKGRNKIVFGDGNPKAELVFIGEGPGADEDVQGLPFVGRAGKLLTQMIEAMGLQRKDVYICNVVKCRPPQNRAPEPDEVEVCSPYLVRQIDVINPRVLVCLGAVAAKTLLQTTRGITQFRGQWMEWRGRKLMATYHPAYLLRNPAAKGEVWKDLQKVMVELGLQAPKKKPS
jgi:uracil-DNA glycosylase